jgi:glycosyltransferase involved in cell wall biosynthesis
MKIGFIDIICDPARPGESGLSDIVWDMARTFAALSDEVHVAGPYIAEPPAGDVSVHRFRIPPIGYRNIVGHGLLVLAAWRQLRRVRDLDVVIAPEYLSTGLLAPFVSTPMVLVTPGNIFERLANGNPFDWSTTQVYKLAARSSARWCRLVDATSTTMEHWWRRTGASERNLTVIPLGVDTSRFAPDGDASFRLGLDPRDAHVVYAGRLSPEKQIDVLLRAIDAARSDDARIKLDVLGEGPQRNELERTAERLGLDGVVTFHGAVSQEQMRAWYSAASAVVLPSRSEPLGRVMLEAMACGAPFIGTRGTGMTDIVNDGVNGFIVPSGEVKPLADQLRALCLDAGLRDRVGRAALHTARTELSWPSVVGGLRAELVERCTATGVSDRDRPSGRQHAVGRV